MKLTKELYIRWLRAAYLYYVDASGLDTGMCDAEWDHISRKFFAERDKLSRSEFPVIHMDNFTGGSLFWLHADQYPPETKA